MTNRTSNRFIAVLLASLCCAQVTTAAEPPATPAKATETASVSQHGITWTFDKAYPAGQFITGDWWVVGPVQVTSVTPAPGPLAKDDTVVTKNQFGDAALQSDARMRNGSMVILSCPALAGKQGFDSRAQNYDPALSAAFPLALPPNRSLISTLSEQTTKGQNLVHQIMWPSEKTVQCVTATAAVLTCLDAIPPADAFRPAYTGVDKTLYREKDLQWGRLQNLKPPVLTKDDIWPTGNYTIKLPEDWEGVERWFERPWLDFSGSWLASRTCPSGNMPGWGYGREWGRAVGIASLMLNLDAPQARKRKLLIGLVQIGIDTQGLIRSGRRWCADGGIWSGRKWPLLFAGLMLGNQEMQNPPDGVDFQEDQQTYYGTGWCGQTVLYQMVAHHGPRRPYEDRQPAQWDDMDKRSEGYRTNCTAQAWIGVALAARLMQAIPAWKHDAFFDYCDRWMANPDPFTAARGQTPRPKEEGKTFDGFVDVMWRIYRDQVPAQSWSGVSRKWVWQNGNKGAWEEQKRP